MGDLSSGTAPSVRVSEERLDSWKEIAAYLNRDVKTAQRWEKREAMPVHRHLHDRMGSVYAFRVELDAWTRSRNLRPAQEQGNGNAAPSPDPTAPPPQPEISISGSETKTLTRNSRTGWKFGLPLAVAVAALAIGTYLWLQRTEYFW